MSFGPHFWLYLFCHCFPIRVAFRYTPSLFLFYAVCYTCVLECRSRARVLFHCPRWSGNCGRSALDSGTPSFLSSPSILVSCLFLLRPVRGTSLRRCPDVCVCVCVCVCVWCVCMCGGASRVYRFLVPRCWLTYKHWVVTLDV